MSRDAGSGLRCLALGHTDAISAINPPQQSSTPDLALGVWQVSDKNDHAGPTSERLVEW